MTPSEALRKAAEKENISEMGKAAFRSETALHLPAYIHLGDSIKEAIFRSAVYENSDPEPVRAKILHVANLMDK